MNFFKYRAFTNIKDKLITNQNFSKQEIKIIYNNFNYIGLNPLDQRRDIHNILNKNIREIDNEITNLKNHLNHIQERRNKLFENLIFFQNLKKIF